MSEAYERERQNNARLEELSAKVSSLRGVTVDIYDNARAQDIIDNTVRSLSFLPFFLPCLLAIPPSPWHS
jgi:blocked early in transport 1